MIRRHLPLLRSLLAVADGLAALLAITVISSLRFGGDWQEVWESLFAEAWTPAVIVAIGWIAILWSRGLYSLRTRWSLWAEAEAVGRAMGLMAMLTFAALFLFKLPDVSRLFLLALLPSLAVSAFLIRAAVHGFFVVLRRHGRNSRFVVMVGSGPTALRFARELEGHPALGLKIIGYLNGGSHESVLSWPFLGSIDQLGDVLHTQVVDEVAVCLDFAEWHLVQEIVELCRAEGKIVRVPLAGAIAGGKGTHVEDLGGLPVLSITVGPDRQLALSLKRILDAAAAGIGLLVAAPFMALIGLGVMLADGRPVLFRQQRVGLHGRPFHLLKFRTMIRGAEERKEELDDLNEITGPAFKVTDDPRVTGIGRFLRRTSLDELPQLWNVLKGEMSLVGPRPPLPAEVKQYDPWHRRRLSMKPGITGLWQVASRRDPHFDQWVERDLEYIDRWSLWLDVQIALRTIPRLLRLEGR